MIAIELPWEALSLSEDDVYTEMGYHGVVPQDDFRALTREAVAEVKFQSPCPRFCLISVDASLDGLVLSVGETHFNVGGIISRQLKGSEAYVFFVATAGHGFDNWLQTLKRDGDIAKTYIADTMGSIIAEKTADAMEKELERTLAVSHPGWLHTSRFSPGYCGWHVREQQMLFSLFPVVKPCGVTLTDSSLMLPIKSVSGVIGLGEKARKLDYSCGLCTAENCYKRRLKK